MECSVTPPSLALGEGKACRDNDNPIHVDTDAEAEANKQRRKVQNRKNQRAHRLRIREQVLVQTSRPFRVERWRLDKPDDCDSQNASSSPKVATATYISSQPPQTGASASMLTPERAGVLRRPTSTATGHAQMSLTLPSFTFPLSTDHLLHLVQYNVFRAFVSNKRTLNTLLTGWVDHTSSRTSCPISGPYRDDTSVYPLNPNIPLALVPTRLQQTRLHSFWINLFPFPSVRDNLIRRDGSFDHWELLQDLIGELMMAAPPAGERRGTPVAITVSDPNPIKTLPLTAGLDEDEVTAGRKGLIVWGEPHDMLSWEVTPGFLAKWSWAVEGCDDLIESSNRWRLMRGEEPMRLAGSKS